MTTTLKEQAWQSGLVLLQDETPEWNFEDWPPLEGGWRFRHALVVLYHPDPDHDSNNNNNKRQTVVVLGGADNRYNTTNSVLFLNLDDGQKKQWRDGPPMNTSREGHAAVVCNGGVYVVGGEDSSFLTCIERIDSTDLLQEPSSTFSSSTTHESCWTRLTCRLSEERWGCCAVAVRNRYIVVMGSGRSNRYLSSVDILDTSNHTVTAGPNMTVPRACCASAVIGQRIFVVGGCNDEDGYLDSVEYLDYATHCDSDDETNKETGSTFLSFSPTWTTHSELRLVNVQSSIASSCATVAVGSCLVVAAGSRPTVQVLDTHRNNHVWNLPPLGNDRDGCTLVTVANQVAVIGGRYNSTCATVPVMDRNSWCFRRLQSNGWSHSLKGSMGTFRDAHDISPLSSSSTWTVPWKRARLNPCQTDGG